MNDHVIFRKLPQFKDEKGILRFIGKVEDKEDTYYGIELIVYY